MKLRNFVCFISVFGAVSADIGSLMQVDVRTHEGAQEANSAGHAEVLKLVHEKISMLDASSDKLALQSMMKLVTSPTGPGFTEARNDTPTPNDSNQTFWQLEEVIQILYQLLGAAEGGQSDNTEGIQNYSSVTLPGCENLYMDYINSSSNFTIDAKQAHEACRAEELTTWNTALHATTGKCTLALKVVESWDTLGENDHFPTHDGTTSASGSTGATNGDICNLPDVCDTRGPNIDCTTNEWKTFFSNGVSGFQSLQADFNHTVDPCIDARDDLVEKTSECNQKQANFEGEFCNWYNAVKQGCAEQNACVQALSDQWDDETAALDGQNDKEMAAAKVITHVICLLEHLQQAIFNVTLCDHAGTNDTYFEEVFKVHYDDYIPPWPTNCSVTTYGAVPYPGDAAFRNDSNSGYSQYHMTVTPVAPTTLDCEA